MTATATLNSAQARRVIAAGMIGNVLEWYDFAIYGYFAPQIGRQFFPHEDAVAQLLSAFGVFALGYLMRPVGGALIGHIGDRLGRRAALTFSIASMAIPTFLMGLLPGYATLGIAAPLLLTLLRMVQGLSVGGEYTGSMVFLVEHAPPGRRGLMGALTSCGASAGILLGSAVGAGFAASMSEAELAAWGWRIPFLLGLVVGIAGYFLRRHVLETVPAERPQRAPLIETLSDHWRVVLGLAGLSVFNAVAFYVSFVFLVSWLQTADGIAPAHALAINSISMAMLLPVMIVIGLLADRFGRKPFLLLATVLGFVGALPLFWLLFQTSTLLIQLGQLGFVLIVGIYGGAQPTFMVEMVPVQVRCTAVALGYNICLGVIGGMTPLVATWLVERTADETAPAFLIMAAAAVSFVTILRLRETFGTPFVGGRSVPAAGRA
jgi:MHS family proline/betaine transporter-like MFS transporter